MNSEIDHRVETEDEFFVDFSGWELTDDELEEILVRSRQTQDNQLRRLVKQAQYFRWLLPKLLELAERSGEKNQLIELARAALRTTTKK